MGIGKPFGYDPWPLHMGVFVVWLPTVLVAIKHTRNIPRNDAWKVILRGCPDWMKNGFYVIFGYAILSFIVFIVYSTQSSSGNDASVVRGFSGHWLVFYYAAFATLYSELQLEKQDPIRRCRNGHVVELGDKYCRDCGEHVGKGY